MKRRSFCRMKRELKKSLICVVLIISLLSGCTNQGSRPAENIPVDSDVIDESRESTDMTTEESILDKITSDVYITFIANCGFLIESGGKKILVDALWRNSPQYSSPSISTETLELMEKALPPFDDVDLILTTHIHWDHFDQNSVRNHMENNPNAVFVSTLEAVNLLKMGFPDFEEVKDRIIGVEPDEGERVQLYVNGIRIEVLNLPHGDPVPRNNGYLL